MRIATPFIFLLALSQLISCGVSKTATLERSLQEYNNDQWLLSEMWAKKTIKSGKNIGEAQYIMGLCEFQLQKVASAKEWFEKAATSASKEVKGKATAMLGVIASGNGDETAAQLAYKYASIHLQGSDQQIANQRSGILTKVNNYTLQFGAYRDKENAQNAVKSISSALKRANLGNAWITEETSKIGRTLYLVRAGHFPTRNSASTTKDEHDLPECDVRSIATVTN
ncbi:MAG: SPOR domain-containing protein [Planctomycetes bacterium]|nr:SPOR domain-containing protein [Planctomycetota bacterium]